MSLLAVHYCEKKGEKKSASERRDKLCEKKSSSQQTNTLSQLTEAEGNKEKRLFHSQNGQKDIRRNDSQSGQLTYDCRIKKRARDMSWVIYKSLVNESDIKYDNYLHMLAQEIKQFK